MKKDELNAFHHLTTLPNYVQPHMESAKWLLDFQPTRREILERISAYIAVEDALRHQGRAVKFRVIVNATDSGTSALEHVTGCAKEFLAQARVAPGRIDLRNGFVRVDPNICKHCNHEEDDHAEGRCLFQSTTFEPKHPFAERQHDGVFDGT